MERNITLSSEMRRNPVRNTESYDDLLEAKQWALDTQKGRRNLDKWALGKIALKLRPEIEAKAKANQDTRTDLLTILSKGQSLVNTRKELADGVGIDERTMGKVMQIDEHAPAAGKEALDKGKLSVNQGHRIQQQIKISQRTNGRRRRSSRWRWKRRKRESGKRIRRPIVSAGSPGYSARRLKR